MGVPTPSGYDSSVFEPEFSRSSSGSVPHTDDSTPTSVRYFGRSRSSAVTELPDTALDALSSMDGAETRASRPSLRRSDSSSNLVGGQTAAPSAKAHQSQLPTAATRRSNTLSHPSPPAHLGRTYSIPLAGRRPPLNHAATSPVYGFGNAPMPPKWAASNTDWISHGHSRSEPNTEEPSPDVEPNRRASGPAAFSRPYHQVIHSGRIKAWRTPVPTDPLGPEDIETPYVHKYKIDARRLMPAVLSIFQDKPETSKQEEQGALRTITESPEYSARSKHRAKSKDKMVASGHPSNDSTKLKRDKRPSESNGRPVVAMQGSDSGMRFPAHPTQLPTPQQQQQTGKEYQPKGATIFLEPILENKTLRIPRKHRTHSRSGSDKAGYDPSDPLVSWYFPRRSPNYWEMLDDVSNVFSDLQLQQVTLKHFQRPVDYVTVLLCLSNVVFAEMFSTLQEKAASSQYRIEFIVSGRTGVNLYLSAYSREHTYIVKSLLHKVNLQMDLARKHSPRSTIQYVQLVECQERYLVHDRRKSWGRIPDGTFATWTDMDSPTVIHEVGIAESRAELYRKCKRYITDIPSVNLVVAIKLDSTECEWAELLLLARDPGNDKICKIYDWVRFWGEGAVNRGDLRYYPSDFLEVEDRWKIPKAHMRPLDAMDGPRCSIVKISFGELGRMVSLARWENQALLGYIKKPYPWPAGHGGLTHMEKVHLEGELPRDGPDMARTLAIANALSDRAWREKFVQKEWRDRAAREVQETFREVGDDGEISSSDDGEDDEADGGDGDRTAGVEESVEDLSVGDKEEPVWPKGATGLL
ncbi:hypothetical protein DL546_001148 [Coniochaeta pulveracea]|uniref:Uncharacterized protein n=1 Tax=Coniochaeta pulveracea TaxID=177199 RepID=A0A420Y280_9PEZI|nr:hypothetical protein DL546_001148 [Coniochaeta pulveracea]